MTGMLEVVVMSSISDGVEGCYIRLLNKFFAALATAWGMFLLRERIRRSLTRI